MTGIVVVELASNGQAAKVGIRLHDLLYKYNGEILNSTEELIAASRAGTERNEMQIIRGRELLNFVVASGSLGVSVLPYPVQDIHLDGVGEVLARFRNEDELEKQSAKEAKRALLLEKISNIQVTTTPSLENYSVNATLGIVTAEYVAGVNFIRDFLSEVTDSIGGRSVSLQKELREMRETCIADLKIEAHNLGANAVIGVDLDYSEISGGGKSMLFLVASGTAVIVEKA